MYKPTCTHIIWSPLQKDKALAVITQLLAYQTRDPLLLSCQFRCLQTGLALFLEFDHQTLQAYLNKVGGLLITYAMCVTP